MRVVVRNELHAKQHLYASYQREFFTYAGEPVPAPKWAEPGTVALSTGDPKWPVRVIHPNNIVSIDDQPNVVPQISSVRVVQVKGSKGDTYTVTIDKGGRTCTCTGFQFRKSCKHIAEAA